MKTWEKLTDNFTRKEFSVKHNEVDTGAINVHPMLLCILQIFRMWLGLILNIHSGCRNGNGKSMHDINYTKGSDGACIITPKQCTAADISTPTLNCWQLMDKLEKFDSADVLFKGRGVYPDTNNSIIHIDCGQYCPYLYDRRKYVKRWVALTSKDTKKRKKGLWDYYNASEGESFVEMRKRLGL